VPTMNAAYKAIIVRPQKIAETRQRAESTGFEGQQSELELEAFIDAKLRCTCWNASQYAELSSFRTRCSLLRVQTDD
jgi:hypothetical protein